MSVQLESDRLATLRFGIGQPVPRKEDPVLVRGAGRYSDDLNLPGQAYAVIARSPLAHGRLLGIDKTTAEAMPGVLAIYTADDLAAAGYGPMPCMIAFPNRDGSALRKPLRHALASGKVRFVGDPIACVVAHTALQAKDAAEALGFDIEELPSVTDARAADAPDAPLLYDDVPNNLVLDYHYGDSAAVAAAFAKAHHVTRLRLRNSRVVVNAMEPRSAIASYEAADGRWTLQLGCQGVFGLRNQIAGDILKVPPERLRVLSGNVGGSFGMKAFVYPEYVCLLHAARALGRPVKWTDERSGSFLSDQHGRDSEVEAELALDAEGRFLAVRVSSYANMGGYLGAVGPMIPTINVVKNMVSMYRTPLIEVDCRCMMTNTSSIGAYRGAGRPEGNYYMERLIDRAAAETGIDRVELRRRNHIAVADMPYAAPSGMTYDSGEFTPLLERALEAADWQGFDRRRETARAAGRLLGRGIGAYLEVTAPPMREMGGIRFEADGAITIITGTLDYGQGHATPFAQILSERLGVPFDRIRLLQGDSDQLIAGGGTGGSKSLMASGAAIIEAAEKVIEKGRLIASYALEAAPADIEFAAGRFRIAGTDRSIGIMELVDRLRTGPRMPAEVPSSLDVAHIHEAAPSAFPNGCHVAEVEVDPETGVARLTRYTAVNDFGVIVNPLLVEGQMHGGIAQGLGQALLEHTVYDDAGQLLTGSYMDYAMPRADNLPAIRAESRPVPAKTNLLGAKGCGEAGCAGSLPAIVNALIDALSERGVTHIDMPATPLRIWEALEQAKARAGR